MLTQTDLNEIEKIVEIVVEEKISEKTNLLPSKDEFLEKMDEVVGGNKRYPRRTGSCIS